MKFRLRSSLGVAATIVGIGLVWGGSPARGAPPCPSGAGIGKADSCHINVNCVDGLPEKRAVVKIAGPGPMGTETVASGVLLNDAQNSGTPWVLTALHVIDVDGNGIVEAAEANFFGIHAKFAFALESNCDGTNPSLGFQVEGATVVASDTVVDLALLQVSISPQQLSANADPFFAGWDSLLLDPPPNVHMIHHPCCDVQMLSGGESPFRMGDDFIALAGWRCGGSERGSSGSPLFATATRTVLGAFSGLLVEPPGATDGLSCAPDSTIHLFGAYNGFGHQFLGALPSVPGHDPA